MSTAHDYYTEGKLQKAIDAATETVRSQPADEPARVLLSELLVFAGDLDRADVQMEAIAHQASERVIDAILFRQLLRAEQARRQFFSEGRLPEMLEGSTSALRLHLEASIQLREGNEQEARQLLLSAAQQRTKITGVSNDKPFDDLRDIDELTSPLLELLTGNGKYYWVDFERISSVEFREPKRLRDLLWRSAHIIVEDGMEGEVYVPVLYVESHTQDDDRLRLGRMTNWRGGDDAVVRGVGQKMFQIGDDDITILELRSLTINRPG